MNLGRLRWLKRGLALSMLGAVFAGALPTHAAPWSGDRDQFASPRFQQVWSTSDQAVAQGSASRSWTWGPTPWFDYREFYQQAPNGLRLVQYFDKARMEINNPANTTGALGGVTNGLLPVEMVSGRIKLGDGTGTDQNEQRGPASQIAVVGDETAVNPSPTYASFRAVATTDNAYRDPNKVGQRVGQTIDKNGAIGLRNDLANQPGTEIVVYETVTGHNVPKIFDAFRNSLPGVRAIDAFGLPITDAYWVRANVRAQEQDVLVQIFERRVITYTPSNPVAFKVEMGNVGQHYFRWRYPQLGPAWNTTDLPLPISFASKRDTAEFDVYKMDPNGANQFPVTTYNGDNPTNIRETVPFSVHRSWYVFPPRLSLWGDTKRFSDKRQLISTDLTRNPTEPERSQRMLTSNANDYNPAVSPDGTKVAFVSDRDGNADLYLFTIGSSAALTRLTDTVGCVNQYPSWAPDGSALVYESNCAGNFEIYRGTLQYAADQTNDLRVARLISPVAGEATRLTTNTSDDRYPRVSPDGGLIAFTATRDGNAEVYTMAATDGSRQTRLTSSTGNDDAPTWSPDGAQLAFDSNRDGDYEIFVMNRDGSGQVQLTNNGQDDGFPIWAQ